MEYPYPTTEYDVPAILAIQRNFKMNDLTVTGVATVGNMRANSMTFLEADTVPGGTPAAGTGTMWLDNSGSLESRLKYTDSDGVEHTVLSSAGAINLGDLADVTISSAVDGDALVQIGGEWVNMRAPFESVMGNYRARPTGTTNSVQSDNSSILAGVNGTINLNCANSAILGGDGLVVSTPDTVAMPNAAVYGQLYMNSNVISDLATPSAPTDAANKAYVDSVASGLDVKQSCRAATTLPLGAPSISGSPTYNSTGGTSGRGQITATLAVSNTFIIDGVLFSASTNGARILIKDQVAGAQNGIWTVLISGTAITFNRAEDFDSDAEVTSGAFTFIEEGSTQAGYGFVLTTPDPIQIGGVGGTSLSWTQFSGATYVAGNGIDITANTVSTRLKTNGGIAFETSELALNLGHTNITGQLDALTKISNLPYRLTGTGVARIQPSNVLVTVVQGNHSAALYGSGNACNSTGSYNAVGGLTNDIAGTSSCCSAFGYSNNVLGGSTYCSIDSANAEITDSSVCYIYGGANSSISNTNNSSIFGAYDGSITGEYSQIFGGIENVITTSRGYIFGGRSCEIQSGLDNAIVNSNFSVINGVTACTIIGGTSITASVQDAVYMPNLIVCNNNTGADDGGSVTLEGSKSSITADMLAARPLDPGAGRGTIWVKNTSPSTLMFTDSADVDHTVGFGSPAFEFTGTGTNRIRVNGSGSTNDSDNSSIIFGDANSITSTGSRNLIGGLSGTISGTSSDCVMIGGYQSVITGGSGHSSMISSVQSTITGSGLCAINGSTSSGIDDVSYSSEQSYIGYSKDITMTSSIRCSVLNSDTVVITRADSSFVASAFNSIITESYNSTVLGASNGSIISSNRCSILNGSSNTINTCTNSLILGGNNNNMTPNSDNSAIIASTNTGFYGGQTNAVVLAKTSGNALQFSNMVYVPRMLVDDGNAESGSVELAGNKPCLIMKELIARPIDPNSGKGLLWVRDTGPSTLIYTDDDNNDRAILRSATYSIMHHLTVAGGADAAPDGSSIVFITTTTGDTNPATGTLANGTLDGQTMKLIMTEHAVDYILSFTAGDYLSNTGSTADTSFTFSTAGQYINLVWCANISKWLSTGHNVAIA